MGQRLFIGIDPGLDGALAVVSDDGAVIYVEDVPTTQVKSSRTRHLKDDAGKPIVGDDGKPLVEHVAGHKRIYEPAQMRAMLVKFSQPATLVVLERVGTRPHESPIGAFSLGHGVGLWEGLLVGLEMPHLLVAPQTWKPALKVSKDKNEARIAAVRQWPKSAPLLQRKKDHGRAEALWLAEYGRRQQAPSTT